MKNNLWWILMLPFSCIGGGDVVRQPPAQLFHTPGGAIPAPVQVVIINDVRNLSSTSQNPTIDVAALLANQSATHAQATSSSDASNVASFFNQFQDPHFITDLQNQGQTITKNIKQYYLWYIFATAYGSLCYTIIKGNRFLNRNDLWAKWKYHLSIDELQAIAMDTLASDLIQSIQHRYINPKNPTDFVRPLVLFVTQIENEEATIKRYLTLTQTIKRCYLSKLFPFNAKKIEQAQLLLKRLGIIKHIFISWSATHNMQQVVKSAKRATA